MAESYLSKSGIQTLWAKIKALVAGKQDKLISGSNIKTINGASVLGSGNISCANTTEQWTFTMADGTTVTKNIYVG